MNRTLISLVVTALFAGAGNAALAQQGTDTPSAASKAAYTAAQDKAQTTYLNATAKCEAAQGAPTAACLSDAQLARNKSLAEAKTTFEGKGATMTPDSTSQANAGSSASPVVDSGADNGLLSSSEREERPGQAGSSADSPDVRSGGDPIAARQGGRPTGTANSHTSAESTVVRSDDDSLRNPQGGPDGTAASDTSGTDTPKVTSRNEEGIQGGSDSTMDGTNAQRAGRDTAPGNPSISKADKAARNAEASARYKQAMAKCDAVSGGAKFTCREEAEQERRDALAQAATDGNNAVRRSRTGGDALSANDDPEYRNVSTARGDTK